LLRFLLFYPSVAPKSRNYGCDLVTSDAVDEVRDLVRNRVGADTDISRSKGSSSSNGGSSSGDDGSGLISGQIVDGVLTEMVRWRPFYGDAVSDTGDVRCNT
jgi:hypothetical protein